MPAPCNSYYLVGECTAPRCKFSHLYELTAGQLAEMKRGAEVNYSALRWRDRVDPDYSPPGQFHPCNAVLNGFECEDIRCPYGHRCPRGTVSLDRQQSGKRELIPVSHCRLVEGPTARLPTLSTLEVLVQRLSERKASSTAPSQRAGGAERLDRLCFSSFALVINCVQPLFIYSSRPLRFRQCSAIQLC